MKKRNWMYRLSSKSMSVMAAKTAGKNAAAYVKADGVKAASFAMPSASSSYL